MYHEKNIEVGRQFGDTAECSRVNTFFIHTALHCNLATSKNHLKNIPNIF